MRFSDLLRRQGGGFSASPRGQRAMRLDLEAVDGGL